MSKVWLRALEPDDYIYTHTWRLNDGTWNGVAGTKRFISLDTERRWIHRAIESHEKGSTMRFVICIDDSEEPVGLITANSIDDINKSCELGSLISPDSRGKGIMHTARIKVYDYLFNQLGLNRIESRILVDNHASRRSQEKFGSTQEGTLRKAIYKNGEFKDLVCYSMLKSEFYELHAETLKNLS